MKRSLAFLLCLLLSSFTAAAESNGSISYQDATNIGSQLGKSLNPGVTQRINPGDAQNLVPRYGADPSQKEYFKDGSETPIGPGSLRVSNCISKDDPECQAVNLLQDGAFTRPQFDLKNDPLVTRAKSLTKDPSGLVGDIFSSYESCKKTLRDISPLFETQICNEFSYNEDKTCTMGQLVVVDPNHIYKCLETIQSQAKSTCTVGRIIKIDPQYNYECRKTPVTARKQVCERILVVACPQAIDGCDTGGLVPGTTQGDMRVHLSKDPSHSGSQLLEFGTFANNYWKGMGAVFDRTLTFEIKNIEEISTFTLLNAAFDDWMYLILNDNLVYVGPYGGDRLDITYGGVESGPNRTCQLFITGPKWICYSGATISFANGVIYEKCTPISSNSWNCTGATSPKVRYCQDCYGNFELDTSWNFVLNKDLKPFLRNGLNTMKMRVIVGGSGEGAIKIRLRYVCPRDCEDKWDNQCQALEARS